MKYRFYLRTWLILAALVAGSIWLCRQPHSEWMDELIGVVLMINLFGAITAVILTVCAGFPTDGGYRNSEIRAEQSADEDRISEANKL